jgi:hypothetical protein
MMKAMAITLIVSVGVHTAEAGTMRFEQWNNNGVSIVPTFACLLTSLCMTTQWEG